MFGELTIEATERSWAWACGEGSIWLDTHININRMYFRRRMCTRMMIAGRSSRGNYDDRWPRFYVRDRDSMIMIVMYVVVGDQWTAKCECRLIQTVKEKRCVNKACGGLLIARVLLITRLLPYIETWEYNNSICARHVLGKYPVIMSNKFEHSMNRSKIELRVLLDEL